MKERERERRMPQTLSLFLFPLFPFLILFPFLSLLFPGIFSYFQQAHKVF